MGLPHQSQKIVHGLTCLVEIIGTINRRSVVQIIHQPHPLTQIGIIDSGLMTRDILHVSIQAQPLRVFRVRMTQEQHLRRFLHAESRLLEWRRRVITNQIEKADHVFNDIRLILQLRRRDGRFVPFMENGEIAIPGKHETHGFLVPLQQIIHRILDFFLRFLAPKTA